MDLKEIKKKIDVEGYIHTIAMFEVIGNPKDYVEKTISAYMDKLKADANIEVINIELEPAEEEDKLWSTVAEVEFLSKNLEQFTWICMNFMPSSIEIVAPAKLAFKAREITSWTNDLLAKLHELGVLSNQLGQQNKLMLKNINAIVRNSVLICLDNKINVPEDIAKKIGLKEADLKPVFDALEKEKTVKKEDNKYFRK